MNPIPLSGFPYYISLTKGKEIRPLFSLPDNLHFFKSIKESQSMHRYLPDKWSIKQLLGHITDHERIMIYRALRVSRRDETVLPGYDQELLVANSRFDEMEWTFLLDDFAAVRNSTIRFIESLSKEQFQLQGHVWQYEISVEDILRATIGHELHHVDVIKNRYLKNEF